MLEPTMPAPMMTTSAVCMAIGRLTQGCGERKRGECQGICRAGLRSVMGLWPQRTGTRRRALNVRPALFGVCEQDRPGSIAQVSDDGFVLTQVVRRNPQIPSQVVYHTRIGVAMG